MAQIPVTSITLLKDLARGTDSVRWTEFFQKYEQPMRAFLRAKFRMADADDVIQETMIVLTRQLPDYHYTPDAKGHFRNYVLGILKHKAEDALKSTVRENDRRAAFGREPPPQTRADEDNAWRLTVMNAAIDQLMGDGSINVRTREIFRHVALLHESAESVASQFGVTRNNVDQIKNRLIRRLTDLVGRMAASR